VFCVTPLPGEGLGDDVEKMARLLDYDFTLFRRTRSDDSFTPGFKQLAAAPFFDGACLSKPWRRGANQKVLPWPFLVPSLKSHSAVELMEYRWKSISCKPQTAKE